MMVIGRKGTADSTSNVCPNQYQSTTHTYRRKKNKRQTKLDYLLMENMFRLQMSLMPRPYGDFDMKNIRYLCSMLKWKNMIILMEIDVGSTMSALEQDSPATHTHTQLRDHFECQYGISNTKYLFPSPYSRKVHNYYYRWHLHICSLVVVLTHDSFSFVNNSASADIFSFASSYYYFSTVSLHCFLSIRKLSLNSFICFGSKLIYRYVARFLRFGPNLTFERQPK